MTDESLPHQLCYIGRTEKTVSERFQGHLRDAKKFKGGVDGDGKLHAVMSAQGFSGFIVEELDSATTAQELALQSLSKKIRPNKQWVEQDSCANNNIQN